MPHRLPQPDTSRSALLSLDELFLEHLNYRGETRAKMLKLLRAPDRPGCTMMDAGTVALDIRFEDQDISDDPAKGDCHIVRSDGVIAQTGKRFSVPEESVLRSGHTGGIGNAAQRIAELERNEAQERGAVGAIADETHHRVLALLGPLGDDLVGRVYGDLIPLEIDRELLRPRSLMPGASGLSIVRVHGRTDTPDVRHGDRAIQFCPGVNGRMTFTEEDVFEIYRRRPDLFHFSYPGFAGEGMDRAEDDGQTMAWLVDEVQRFCPIVSTDVHGPTQMRHIERSLPRLDMVNGNLAEMVRIFCGQTIDASKELQTEEKEALFAKLKAAILPYIKEPTGRTRMFTATDSRGCFTIFKSGDGNVRSEYLLSPCADITADNTTGAGDVRCGIQRLHIARNQIEAWKNGCFAWEDAAQAVQIGQIAATLHVQGKDANAFEGVTLKKLENVATSGKHFATIQELQEALRRA